MAFVKEFSLAAAMALLALTSEGADLTEQQQAAIDRLPEPQRSKFLQAMQKREEALKANTSTKEIPFITLEARSGETGNTVTRGQGSMGDSTKWTSISIDRKQSVDVEYHSFGPSEGIEIYCYFLGKSRGRHHIYDSGVWSGKSVREKVRFEAKKMFGRSEIQTKTAATAEAATASVTTISQSTGSKSGGWIVFLAYKGKLVRMRTSLPELEKRANIILRYGATQYSIVDGLDQSQHLDAHAENIQKLIEDVRDDAQLGTDLKSELEKMLEKEAAKAGGNPP